MASKISRQLAQLEDLLRSYGSVAVGFSGGVDSSFLAAVCARCMPDRTLLVHLDTPLIGTPEQTSFEHGTRTLGLKTARIAIDPLGNPDVASNPADRCYHCKRAGFGRIVEVAREHGISTVIDGSNADDADDYRPGMRAAEELGVHSPLMETGWHKADERELLREWGMPVWNLQPGACLATRIPCGEALTARKLEVVRACEDYLHGLGLRQVRVRLTDGRAQVTAAPDDLERLAEISQDDGAAKDGGRHAGRAHDAVALAPAVTDALSARGVHEIDPLAHLYVHGATSRVE